jgi:Restriction endonuclease
MTSYDPDRIAAYIADGMNGALTTKARGDALEELVCYFLSEVPGLRLRRNGRDPFHSQEIDITVANAQTSTWMKTFPTAMLVECKNWDNPVGVTAVSSFIYKLEVKSVALGIIVAANGVTGDPDELTASYQRIAMAQSQGHRVLVLRLDELKSVGTVGELELLLVDKFLEAVSRGVF